MSLFRGSRPGRCADRTAEDRGGRKLGDQKRGGAGPRHTIVSCERLVSDEEMHRHPERNTLTAAIIDLEGTKVGFLGYNSILPQDYWANEERPAASTFFFRLRMSLTMSGLSMWPSGRAADPH